MPFFALRRFRATPGATGIDNTISPMEIFATVDGMCAIVVAAKACKSMTFIAPRRSYAACVAARRSLLGQYLCERLHHAA
jgi:hypothetical protein